MIGSERGTRSGGSSSSSDVTSAQVFSCAPASPGEHGVNFRSLVGGSDSGIGTITWRNGRQWGRPADSAVTAYLLEMRSAQHLSYGLHQRVSNDNCDIGSRVSLRLLRELSVFRLSESAWRSTDVELEHSLSRVRFRKRNVDSLFESVAQSHQRAFVE